MEQVDPGHPARQLALGGGGHDELRQGPRHAQSQLIVAADRPAPELPLQIGPQLLGHLIVLAIGVDGLGRLDVDRHDGQGELVVDPLLVALGLDLGHQGRRCAEADLLGKAAGGVEADLGCRSRRGDLPGRRRRCRRRFRRRRFAAAAGDQEAARGPLQQRSQRDGWSFDGILLPESPGAWSDGRKCIFARPAPYIHRGLSPRTSVSGQTRALPSGADHDALGVDRQERQGLLADECQATFASSSRAMVQAAPAAAQVGATTLTDCQSLTGQPLRGSSTWQ